LRKQFVA